MILQDKVALFTGATGALGASVTKAFAEAGATVAALSRSDLATPEAARTAVDALLARHGRIDAAVHLAGAFDGGASTADTPAADFERMFDANFKPALHFLQAVIPHMRAQRFGAIIAIGGRTAVEPRAGLAAYTASKAALAALVRTVALENKDAGVSANVVLPGTMDTPANRAAMANADPSQWVQTSQVAALLVHLASSSATQVTGALIPVYGAEL